MRIRGQRSLALVSDFRWGPKPLATAIMEAFKGKYEEVWSTHTPLPCCLAESGLGSRFVHIVAELRVLPELVVLDPPICTNHMVAARRTQNQTCIFPRSTSQLKKQRDFTFPDVFTPFQRLKYKTMMTTIRQSSSCHWGRPMSWIPLLSCRWRTPRLWAGKRTASEMMIKCLGMATRTATPPNSRAIVWTSSGQLWPTPRMACWSATYWLWD